MNPKRIREKKKINSEELDPRHLLEMMVPILFLSLISPPDWSSRCKQIMKLWRKVPAADKAPYLVRQKEPGVAWEMSHGQRIFGKVTFIPSTSHFHSSWASRGWLLGGECEGMVREWDWA